MVSSIRVVEQRSLKAGSVLSKKSEPPPGARRLAGAQDLARLVPGYFLSRVPQELTLAAVGQDEVPPRLQPSFLQYLSPSDWLMPEG